MNNTRQSVVENKPKYIIYIMYSIIICSYLIGISNKYRNISDIKYILILACILIHLLIYKFKISSNIKTRSIFLLLFIFVTIPPILNSLIIGFNVNIYINIILHITLISFFYFISCEKNSFKKYIIITFILSTSYLFIMFLINDGISTLNPINIKYALDSDLDFRKRQTYGMIHTNTLGSLCFIIIVSGIYILKNLNIRNKKYKFIIRLAVLATSYLLLLSGSRGAITSVVLFILIYNLIKFLCKYIKYINVNLIGISILIIIIFTTVINIIDRNTIEGLIEYANRLKYWNDTIEYMEYLGLLNIIFGLGFYSPGYLFNNSIYTPTVTDNWFVYIYMVMGVFGLIIALGFVLLILIKLTKNLVNIRDNNSIYFFTFFIVYIYYSNIETILLMPDHLSSLIFWSYLLTYLNTSKIRYSIAE